MTEETNSTNFFVNLEGIKLDDDAIRRIESGIRALVMQEIAKIDHQGEIVVKSKTAQKEATRSLGDLFAQKFGTNIAGMSASLLR